FVVTAITMERRMVQIALGAYLLFAIPHLIFHLTHPEHFTMAAAVWQTIVLTVAVLLPVGLLILTAWRPRRAAIFHRQLFAVLRLNPGLLPDHRSRLMQVLGRPPAIHSSSPGNPFLRTLRTAHQLEFDMVELLGPDFNSVATVDELQYQRVGVQQFALPRLVVIDVRDAHCVGALRSTSP